MSQFVSPEQKEAVRWVVEGKGFSNLKEVSFSRVQMMGEFAIVQIDWEIVTTNPNNEKGWAGWRMQEVIAFDKDGRMNSLSMTKTTKFQDGREEVSIDPDYVLPDNSCWE